MEDDFVLANTLLDWLEYKGHEIEHIGDGNEAAEKLNSIGEIEIIVLDWHLPGVNGIDLCKKYNASAIIRGLRAVSDFEYEFQLAGMNKKLNSKIETMFMMSDVENQIISSKFVKEIASLGGDIERFVTKYTVKMLKNRF